MDRNVESSMRRKTGSSLSRRELLAALAGGGLAAWAAAPSGAGSRATGRGIMAGTPAAEAADEAPRYGGVLTQDTFADLPHFAPWMAMYPGVAITLAVFGFNMLGDAVRDVLDPRLRGR